MRAEIAGVPLFCTSRVREETAVPGGSRSRHPGTGLGGAGRFPPDGGRSTGGPPSRAVLGRSPAARPPGRPDRSSGKAGPRPRCRPGSADRRRGRSRLRPPGGFNPAGRRRPRRARGSPPAPDPPRGRGSREGTAARAEPAPVGRISAGAVRRDRLRVGREGPGLGRWPAALARRRVLQPPGLSHRRIPGPREKTAAAPSLRRPPAPPPRGGGRRGGLRAGDGPPRPRRDCQPGRTALSAPRPRRAAGRGGATTGARGPRRRRPPTRPVLKHGPRSLTRARVGG
ncbi:basic salivary proline-rich protein 4-like [Anolis sagrei]|uniref:basic salivary proline-rich protein 4-like n=1 Tax=Anolis sagrei TaxID=38937 RepID=UPI00351F89C1